MTFSEEVTTPPGISTGRARLVKPARPHGSIRDGDGLPGASLVVVGELGDDDALVDRHVAEDLGGAAGGPEDLQARHALRPAQADVLLQRVGPEAAPRADVAVD